MKVQAAKNMSLGAGSTALVLRDTEMWADTVDHGPQNDTGIDIDKNKAFLDL